MEFLHTPVLLNETADFLNIVPGGVYVDATAGGGGHSGKILEKLGNSGRLILVDRDPDAIEALEEKFKNYNNVLIIKDNFSNITKVLKFCNVGNINGILFDIGISSYQLDESSRGFSYTKDALLDMRMSKEGISAKEFLNSAPEDELFLVIKNYGEERYAHFIAKNIVKERSKKEIETTFELVEIIKNSMPQKALKEKGHPAKRTFQAIRIYINSELDNLKMGLTSAFKFLIPGGRMAVITFHSLEDRIVKRQFVSWNTGCICPKDLPLCVCKKEPVAKILTKKAIKPPLTEVLSNKRSKSAKLRVCEKL